VVRKIPEQLNSWWFKEWVLMCDVGCAFSPFPQWLAVAFFVVWFVSGFGLIWLSTRCYPYTLKNKWLARLVWIFTLPPVVAFSLLIAIIFFVVAPVSDPLTF
jgi:hypothetical protein